MGQNSGKQKLTKTDVRTLRRQVSFSEEEIQDWHREFVRSSSNRSDDLFLTEEEFCKVYNSVFPGQSNDFASHVFRTFDLDGDARVDFREFIMGLSLSGSSNSEKKLAWAFRVYDVDNSGYISQEEMRLIYRAVFKMMGPVVLNGVVQDPDHMADDVFQQLDIDGDKQITWEEFRDGASKIPSVLELLQCGPAEDE